MSLPNPVTPSMIQAVVPSATASLCDKFVNALIKFPLLFYQWYSWAFDANGNPTSDFKTLVGVATGAITAPSGVTATDSQVAGVHVSWGAVTNATLYDVYRGDSPDSTLATLIGTVSATSFDDSVSVAGFTEDTLFYYWVKSRNATDTSAFSSYDTGRSDTTGGGGSGSAGSIDFSASTSWTVPAGITHVSVEVWGAGGGGSGVDCTWCSPFAPFTSGGGGGSGEYRHVKTIPVTPAEVLTIFVPTGSGNSLISRGSSILVQANGGGPAFTGGNYPNSGAHGTGGTGGTSTGGVVVTTTAGNDGTDGALGSTPQHGGAAGVGGAAITGAGGTYGAGGNGTTGNGSGGSAGGAGHLKIVWPSI